MATIFASAVVGADPALIAQCVRSMRSSAGSHDIAVRVIVNEPSQRSDEAIERLVMAEPDIVVTHNATPAGFAANHNRAVTNARSDYLLIANDDLVFSHQSVARCIDFLQRSDNRDVAALSPRLLNADGTLQRSTYGFPTVARALLDLSGVRSWIPHNGTMDFLARHLSKGNGKSRFWPHDTIRDVDTFRGAAMFVRSSAWAEVGPLCDVARVGGEIAEWHRRCHDRGWRVVFFPEAEVIHFGSRTVKTDPLLRSEYLKGYFVFFARHGRSGALTAFRGAAFVVSASRLAISAITGNRVGISLWMTNLSLVFQRNQWVA